MTVAEIAAGTLSESEHRSQLRRAVIASTIGTTIEWYDFLLYSIVTGLVFAKLFFPQSDPLVATMQAYAIFFIGFVARPIGAFIFGHYGDRIGRKAALIATLLLTGAATFAVGLVPSYDLNWEQLTALLGRGDPGRFEVVVHQHMPMFHMERCVFAAFLSEGKDWRDCGRPCDHHRARPERRSSCDRAGPDRASGVLSRHAWSARSKHPVRSLVRSDRRRGRSGPSVGSGRGPGGLRTPPR